MIKKTINILLIILIILISPLLIYGLSYCLNYISTNSLNYTQSNIDLWMRTISTLAGTFIGPFAAVKGTLYIQRKNKNDGQHIAEEYSKKIIDLFLIHEIKNNFKYGNNGQRGKYLYELLLEYDGSSVQYGYNKYEFKIDEFEKIKYELIKYNNEYVRDIIEVYYMFDILRSEENLNKFTKHQINNIKEIYLKNFERYY